MRACVLPLLAHLLTCIAAYGGNPSGNVYWLDAENHVTVRFSHEARPVVINSIGIRSGGGYLLSVADGTSPAPFQFFLSNHPTDITASSLSSITLFDTGAFTTFVRYDLERALADGVEPHEDIFATSEIGLCGSGFDVRCNVMGDLNFDFAVNFEDFLILSENFGMSDANWPDGDLNWNKTVDFIDFLRLSHNFESEAAAVPEPATNLLLALGHIGAMRFRIRKHKTFR